MFTSIIIKKWDTVYLQQLNQKIEGEEAKEFANCISNTYNTICWIRDIFGVMRVRPYNKQISFSLPSKDYIFFIECGNCYEIGGGDALSFCIRII